MNYGMLYYGFLPLIGGAVIAWTFVWSHQTRIRKKREKFKRKLQGYKFGSLQELQDHWRGRMDIDLGKDFEPNYHGNLLDTLEAIDKAAKKEWIRWNS